MISRLHRLFAVAAVFLAATLPAAELPILTKARARLGSDAALDALQTLHFVGTLTAPGSGDAAATSTTVPLDILVKRPAQQRITVTYLNYVESTGLNDYEGWMRQQNPADGARWNLTILSIDQVKRLRANTWENVSFFRGLEAKGGHIDDLGPVTLEGIACQKLAFVHEKTIVFYRYFELATGRLVLTETEAGGSVREEGELVVNGIRFPKRVITSSKTTSGKDQVVTVVFDKIVVNEPIDDAAFAVPQFTPVPPAPAAAAVAPFRK